MESKIILDTNWINTTEIYKLDRSETTFEAISSPSFSHGNLSSSSNYSFNTSINLNHTQSWIQTASRIIPLYSVIFLLAVIGNSLVILTLVQNKRMRTITNLFLLNLAVSDLFLGVFCMPFTLVGMLLRDFIFGQLMCKLLPYLQG
jgi:cholecystokinin A receptor